VSIFEQLQAPFPADAIEWRVQSSGFSGEKPWAKIVPYLTNRAIQDRLDEAVGPENWRNEYTAGPQGGVLCGISLYLPKAENTSEYHWVTKWDGAENTDIEGVKGGLSGSMKRAAVQWGIGRFLYECSEEWATFVADRAPGSQMAEIKLSKNGNERKRCWWVPPTRTDAAPPITPKVATPEQLAKIRTLATATGDLPKIESKLTKLTQEQAGEWIAKLTAKSEKERANV
jgi:hypothetical protein